MDPILLNVIFAGVVLLLSTLINAWSNARNQNRMTDASTRKEEAAARRVDTDTTIAAKQSDIEALRATITLLDTTYKGEVKRLTETIADLDDKHNKRRNEITELFNAQDVSMKDRAALRRELIEKDVTHAASEAECKKLIVNLKLELDALTKKLLLQPGTPTPVVLAAPAQVIIAGTEVTVPVAFKEPLPMPMTAAQAAAVAAED